MRAAFVDPGLIDESTQADPQPFLTRVGARRCAPQDVSIKGKTNEGMGFVGRGEGLACLATATLYRAEA